MRAAYKAKSYTRQKLPKENEAVSLGSYLVLWFRRETLPKSPDLRKKRQGKPLTQIQPEGEALSKPISLKK
jgi:hypothetical protein